MKKPKIKITLIERKGTCACHRGHQVGDCFDFDTDRGKLCPMAFHVAFPFVDILRYGGAPWLFMLLFLLSISCVMGAIFHCQRKVISVFAVRMLM